MVKNLKVGDIVWYKERWSGNCLRAKVVRLIYDKEKLYAQLHWDIYGTNIIPCEHLYMNMDEAIKGSKEETAKRISDYKNEISDINSLVTFMYRHYVTESEDSPDYEARQAVKEKAKELLGIGLEE